MPQKPLPQPRTYHLKLADELEQMVKDLRYKPSEGEFVEVDTQKMHELTVAAENIALYQAVFDNMRHIRSNGPEAVKCAIKDLKTYAKRLETLL